MKTRFLLALAFSVFSWPFSYAQCPADETDLANGGTFSSAGTCSIAVGGSMTITGAVIWNGPGILEITGTAGNINIDGGSLTINGGTVQSIDGDDGNIDVINGTVTVAAGANLLLDESIRVYGGGSMTVSGNITSQDRDLLIDVGGSLTLNSTGSINTGDEVLIYGTLASSGGSIDAIGEIMVTGSFTSSGNINITGGSDFVVDGGTAILTGGTVNIDDDLKVYNGGTLVIGAGSTVNVGDNVVNNDDGDNTPVETNGFGQGTIVVDGTLNAGGFLTINNTTPNSGLTGSGTITVQGTFTDNEAGPFDSCSGGGASCSGPLPIELIGFSAELANGEVQLQWSTASELNNNYFTIERASDIEKFETIGTPISGKGTTNNKSNYNAQDENPIYGRSYYRLKQTDFDGKFTYSDLQVVNYEGPRFTSLQVYPIPLKEIR